MAIICGGGGATFNFGDLVETNFPDGSILLDDAEYTFYEMLKDCEGKKRIIFKKNKLFGEEFKQFSPEQLIYNAERREYRQASRQRRRLSEGFMPATYFAYGFYQSRLIDFPST